MRNSTKYMMFLAPAGLIFLGLLLIHPRINETAYNKASAEMQKIAQDLGLTDLCLFTEARYTRHLSQTDLYSAFQDHPMAFEHFPSGSMVKPPRHLIEFVGSITASTPE